VIAEPKPPSLLLGDLSSSRFFMLERSEAVPEIEVLPNN